MHQRVILLRDGPREFPPDKIVPLESHSTKPPDEDMARFEYPRAGGRKLVIAGARTFHEAYAIGGGLVILTGSVLPGAKDELVVRLRRPASTPILLRNESRVFRKTRSHVSPVSRLFCERDDSTARWCPR